MYAMISSGFLPGDVQISGTAPQTYAEETLTAFEIGSKNRFQDERLQINADLFYYRYGGHQQTVIPTGNPNVSYFATVPARMVGGEIEAIYQLTANDRLGLSYAYTDAYYIDKSNYNYTIQEGPTSTTYRFAENVSQRPLAGVVPQTLNLTYDHIFRLPGGSSVTAHADARELWGHYVSDLNLYYVNSGFTNYASYKSYVWIPNQTIANVSATWLSPNDRFSVTAYVRNVADSRYATAVTITASPVAPTSYTGTESDPRTYGAVLTAKF
jgi:iron complex outermembrane receptor protein